MAESEEGLQQLCCVQALGASRAWAVCGGIEGELRLIGSLGVLGKATSTVVMFMLVA